MIEKNKLSEKEIFANVSESDLNSSESNSSQNDILQQIHFYNGANSLFLTVLGVGGAFLLIVCYQLYENDIQTTYLKMIFQGHILQ